MVPLQAACNSHQDGCKRTVLPKQWVAFVLVCLRGSHNEDTSRKLLFVHLEVNSRSSRDSEGVPWRDALDLRGAHR